MSQLRKSDIIPAPNYEVGYRKPPASGQFKKGRSGNPAGRPKKRQQTRAPLKYETTDETLKNTFLEEAYRMVNINTGQGDEETQYDDGGISGGHMERPGLKALIADIEADRVDVIVVYKVDRLTRSLTDFSKLVEVFDSHEVSFVSVTQAFNTTNSMGRLTLNVLLSFAQFEREVTGERIRDKIALSRKRGLWTGGLPPLGYDAIEKKLVINGPEAKAVRHIYRRYAELKNVRRLRAELTEEGYVSKRRTTKSGRATGGKPFERGALYAILKNQTYLGLTTHKGEAFEGEHESIITKALFDKVQTILSSNRQRDKHKTGAKNPSLLAGKIIAPSQPQGLLLKDLIYQAIPMAWTDQRSLLNFPV